MKEFPGLVPQELKLEGRGYRDAAADVKMSSAGKKHLVVITDIEHCESVFVRLEGFVVQLSLGQPD